MKPTKDRNRAELIWITASLVKDHGFKLRSKDFGGISNSVQLTSDLGIGVLIQFDRRDLQVSWFVFENTVVGLGLTATFTNLGGGEYLGIELSSIDDFPKYDWGKCTETKRSSYFKSCYEFLGGKSCRRVFAGRKRQRREIYYLP